MITFISEERLQKAVNRFWSKVKKTETCWLWSAGKSKGYGQFFYSPFAGKEFNTRAHIFAYEILIGDIPEGLQLDHLCRVRHCVNPMHLEPVTQKENILRGISVSALNARKTHCKRGHEFTDENTSKLKTKTVRKCITCRKDRENLKRRLQGKKSRKNITHCPQGHEYNENNAYKHERPNRPTGWRCNVCRRKGGTLYVS